MLRTLILALSLCLPVSMANAADPQKTPVTIWSEGTRMAGDIWRPGDLPADETRPGIVVVQGFPGSKAGYERMGYPRRFAEAGFIVLSFDFRGWNESESRYYAVEEPGEPDADGMVSVRVQTVRDVNDPIGRLEDLQAAVDFLAGEPGVDASRIGLWGTSFGAGNVISIGGRDDRVKAIVAQVGYMKGEALTQEQIAGAHQRATQKARGEIDPLARGLDLQMGANGPNGAQDFGRFRFYEPLEMAKRVSVPTLIIDAEEEELFDRMQNGHAAYEIIAANGVTTDYRTTPGDHYAVYRGEVLRQTTDWAIAWFGEHL